MDDGFKHRVSVLLRCPVCDQTVTDPRALNCGQFYCEACVKLLVEDGQIKCQKCDERTPVADEVKKHVLAAKLVVLLNDFSPKQEAQDEDDAPVLPPPPVMANGINSDHEDEESIHDDVNIQDIAADPIHAEPAPENGEKIDEVEEHPRAPPSPINNRTVDVDVHPDPERDDATPPPPVIKEGEQDSQSGSDNADPPPRLLNGTVKPEEKKYENCDVANSQTLRIGDKPEEEKPKQNGDVKGFDETDRGMTEAEIKASDAPLSIDSQRQCGQCGSKSCSCNVNSLLTPPVSTGSVHSEEQNDSRSPSEIDFAEIPIQMQGRWVVKESASNIEMVSKNKIVVTRWTYDDKGAVQAYDSEGTKIKYTNGGHDNYSGIALSRKGFLLVINTNKDRIEEYDQKGKKVKHISLERYTDPHAVDVMDGGEVLVVDRDRNLVKVIGKDRKKKARIIEDDKLKEPSDIASCKEGFYVSCALTKCILKFDLEGKLLWSYNADDTPEKRNKLKEPQGLCVDEKGNLYVVDKGRHSVLVFDSEGHLKGRLIDKMSAGSKQPWYISVRDGNLAILYDHNMVKTYTFA